MAKIRKRSKKYILILIGLLLSAWLFYKYCVQNPEKRFIPLNPQKTSQIDNAGDYFKHILKPGLKLFHHQLFRNFKVPQFKNNTVNSTNGCPNWIVFSAKHIPLRAVGYFLSLVNQDSNWCCVTLLNKRSIELEYIPLESDRFIVLTLEDQAELLDTASNGSRNAIINTKTPFGKSIGYVYAISHGAKVIYDTREDALLTLPKLPLFGDYRDYVLVSKEDHIHRDFVSRAPDALWRNGFFYPTTARLDDYTFLKEKNYNCTNFDVENVKIINMVKIEQTLLKEKEMGEERYQLALYRGTYAVYEDATTLHDYDAFFGLLPLNNNEDGIYDVLRSVYTQRLLCDLGYNIAIVGGPVNPTNHSESVNTMLLQELVMFVLSWRSNAVTLGERMEELAIEFYEKGYWREEDVLNVQAWLVALIEAGYNFPALRGVNDCTHIPPAEILDCASNKESLDSTHTLPDTQDKNSYRVDFYLRMTTTNIGGPPLVDLYNQIFSRSLKFFWHNESRPINLILVMDDEKEEDHIFGEKKKHEYPYPTVYYEVDKKCYGAFNTNRNQWSMHWADNYTTNEYVGFVDTDTVFNTLLNEDMLFDGHKPHVMGLYGTSLDIWSRYFKASTYEFLKIKEVFKAMNYFPVVFKVKHLLELRRYVENLHGVPFTEVFSQIANRTYVSQYNIMMNYVWYFHRDEYAWHMEESQGIFGFDVPGELIEFPEISERMKIPFPRFTIHYKYIRPTTEVAEGWNPWVIDSNSLKTIHKFMLEGYCFSGGFSQTPDLCTQYNESAIHITLFDFEYHSWLWDDRCLESQRAHYARTSGLKHDWDMSLLE